MKEIQCKSAIGKCGFPGGGFAINPYTGCSHNCLYCYARFMRRFSGHDEKWGTFVDAKINIAEVLAKQLKSGKYDNGPIYIGTVTDPYQEAEKKYELTRNVLKLLAERNIPVSILTKSDLVLRDLDLLKKFKHVDINFTVNTFDEKWKKLVEPDSPSIAARLNAIKKLHESNISTMVMIGPYWPFFTDAEPMFIKFKELGVSKIWAESFNTVGGNWTDVGIVLKKNYPELYGKMHAILFDDAKRKAFYTEQGQLLKKLSIEYNIPLTTNFGLGHAATGEKY